jgi:phosphatidylglycerophosphate synthase
MSYKDLYIKTKTINKDQTKFSNSSIFEFFFRRVSFFLTPVFILFGVTPNLISGLSLIMGLIASLLISFSSDMSINLGVIIFFFACLLDCVDGSVARLNNIATFYGRFIDGLIDIVIMSAIRIALCHLIMARLENELLFWFALIATVLTPFQHFIFDRYSSYARWSNEENGTNIKPYIRRKISPKLAFLLVDIQLIILFSIPMLINSSILGYALSLFFLINIVAALHAIILHIFYSYKNMNVSANKNIHD